jgi:tRNA(Leu) C34 or U34 (ribose-2'-O)-methylase TrmL
VIFPTHRQAPLTPAAIKASAGAVEHLLLCPVDDLPGAMSDLRVRGLRIAAAEADAPLTAAQADLRGPLAIVVGSEGQGLSPAVRRRSDVAVRIPMRGAIGSLNASVAGSILLFAAVAQRDPAGLGDKPARPVGADAWPVRDEPSGDRPTAESAKSARGQSVVAPAPAEASSEPPTSEPKTRTRAARKASTAKAAGLPATESSKPPLRTRAKGAIDEVEAATDVALPASKPHRPTTKTTKTTTATTAATTRAAPPDPAAPEAKKPSRPRTATKAALKGTDTTSVEPARRRTRATTSGKSSKSAVPTPPEEAATNDDDLLPGGPASR